MAFLKVENVAIKGIAACVPKNVVSNLTPDGANQDFVDTTGVSEVRYNGKYATSDYCKEAAEQLISDLNWSKEDIDAIIFVSQTTDYILPATACILQDRLHLPKSCFAMDLGLGCSGWVYGLSTLTSLMQTGYIRKALLMAGDVKTIVQKDDKLFGEAGSVTALEYDSDAKPFFFSLGTDGSGADAIMVPHGGARHYFDETSMQTEMIEGHEYMPIQSRMKGMDVFSFGISTVPKSVKQLAKHFDIDYLSADYFVFHQANMMMNKIIDKKLKLPDNKTLYSMGKFGNTSSASIPLTLVTALPEEARDKELFVIGCGFGVGLSWGTVAFHLNNPVISKLVELA